ncbi:MAG TPA: hypothetical protein PLL20_21380 [Phycisphaerae bacterium]|nr:hypothetical protein [Phycisphaerae bacterium]HRR84917.1 hypothetical protein [Phycisphaerae bacterium]
MSRRHRHVSSRRLRRRLRSQRPPSPSGLRLIATGGHKGEPVVLEMLSFEITEDPIPDPTLDRLRPEDREMILEVGSRVMEGATDQVPILERLAREFPQVPKVYNYLTIAYSNAGLYAKAEEMAEEAYSRFPNYLFAMINYAHALLRRWHIRRVEQILDNRFSIHLWITDRKRYHVSEYVAFNGLMARYFSAIGEDEIAERYYKMLLEVAPDHPGTKTIDRVIHPTPMGSLLKRLTRWAHAKEADQEPVRAGGK